MSRDDQTAEISEAARNLLAGFHETDLAEMLATAQAQLAKPTHPCTTCVQCGRCACWWSRNADPDGCLGFQGCHPRHCDTCSHNDHYRQRAQADMARWKSQRDAGATYAMTAKRLHRWDCHVMTQPDTVLTPADPSHHRPDGYLHLRRLPQLYTAAELRLRPTPPPPSCHLCGPDPL